LPGPFQERRFSYRGLGPDGQPLPYGAGDTYQALPTLDRLVAQQVEVFARQTHQAVSIVAESEGALVAKAYIMATSNAPVRQLILLSPLVEPARVFYPAAGREGWGVGAGYGLRLVTAALRVISPVRISPSTPLVRSIVDEAPGLRGLLPCPVAGVRQLALFPLADAVAAPHTTSIGIPTAVVPAFHGGLLGNGAVRKAVALQLDGGRGRGGALWLLTEEVLRAAGGAWQVPILPLSLNPVWQASRTPSCPQMAARLRAAAVVSAAGSAPAGSAPLGSARPVSAPARSAQPGSAPGGPPAGGPPALAPAGAAAPPNRR
jgi:hypothetical protein